MRNTLDAKDLELIINLAKNPVAWKKVYGEQTLARVLELKTGKTVTEVQTMQKLPPRRLQPRGSRVPKGYKFSHTDAQGRKVFVEE